MVYEDKELNIVVLGNLIRVVFCLRRDNGKEKGVSMKKIWLVMLSLPLFTMLLSGCAASTGVVKMSQNTYMIRVEDHAGVLAFHRGELKTKAIQEANNFAESQKKWQTRS